VIRVAAVTSLLVGLAIAGCGSDSSGEPTAPALSIPAITSPIPSATTTAPTTATAPTGSTTTNAHGNGHGSGNGFNPNGPDSATNDVPPPPGSPQAAFEKQCRQNPKACG
jgi:hypothetical protein